ncbi:unnamed protein product [Periconia digitata]|uniref:DUF3176 domain containing protein n=1 Tax=Periconia digitata TaxID=1303443 RepID=A0A9W4U928_9PLEO|nr:unnamed protein product [Periconia digitata]
MAKAQKPQQWPPYPHIPIYLETTDDIGTARSYRSISPILSGPGRFAQKQSSIHYLAAASTQFTNVSTNVSPVSPATQFTNISPIWPIPEPHLPPPPEVTLQPSQRVALRFFPTARPRIQLEKPLPPKKDCGSAKVPNSGEAEGLGIRAAPTETVRHSFPSVSNLSISPVDDNAEPPENLAQRIERKLWRYSSSGNVIKRWLLEIISWWVSAICMAIIVGTLIRYREQKPPRWISGLTLNTFIAVLSKISGAALILPISEGLGQLKWSWFRGDSKRMWDFEIFDNASRGPWGSFLLLIRTKGKALAALGALVTLCCLALDPFFQQVVDFPERWTLQTVSSIPRVVRYEPKFGIEYRNSLELGRQDLDVRAVAEKFFYDNGTQPMLLGNGTRPEIPLSCPTSNCTYPEYDSLAVCSQCADVSDMLSFKCLNTTVDWIGNLTGGASAVFPNGTMCGYFLNNTMMSGYSLDVGKPWANETLLMRSLPLINLSTKEPMYGNGSINFKDIRNPVMDIIVVRAKDGTVDSVRRNERPLAHECVISWCVQTMKSSYAYGAYEETVVRTVHNNSQGPFPWRSETTAIGTAMYYLEDPLIDPAAKGYNSTDVFGVPNIAHRYTVAIFDDIFPSWITVANSSSTPLMRFKNYLSLVSTRTLEFDPWLTNDMSNHFGRLASAMTNAIRSSSSKVLIYGDAYDKESYVAVRWEWLSLPLGLLLLTAIFLVATIVKTTKEKDEVGVWKTSAIATLLYGLPDDMQRKINASDGEGTPRAKAKHLKVKLLPKKGWRASGNLFSPITPKTGRTEPPPGWV